MQDGKALIKGLKNHVLEKMRDEPECRSNARGLGNTELEKICDLELHLDAHDHWLMYSLLHSLIQDGRVEQVRWPEHRSRSKYRLCKLRGKRPE